MFEGYEPDPMDDDKYSDYNDVSSPEYSDRWSSDLEDCMYGKIHHTDKLDFQVVHDNDSDEPCSAKFSNHLLPGHETLCSPAVPVNAGNSVLIVEATSSRQDGIFSNEASVIEEESLKTPGTSKNSPIQQTIARNRVIKSREKGQTIREKFSRKFFSAKTSTPVLDITKNHYDRHERYDYITDSCTGESSDEIVFVDAIRRETKRSKRKDFLQNNTSNTKSSRGKNNSLKITKHSSLKESHTVSVSDSSSDDIMYIDSMDCSNDLMTNVNSNCDGSSHNNSFSNSDVDETELSLSPVTDSSESSDYADKKRKSWHIDAVDRIATYRDKKSLKRKYFSTCRRCRGTGHNEHTCWKTDHFKCYLCGGVHEPSVCSKKVCGLCYSSGHDRNQCLYPMQSITCGNCKVVGHMASRCPDIWRRYHLTISPGLIRKGSPVAIEEPDYKYCYNCGHNGHFGHQCQKPRLHRQSKPCLPYIISYKNPKKLMETCPIPRSWPSHEKLLKKNVMKQKKPTTRFSSKPGVFQRTPKTAITQDSELKLSASKKRKFRKRKGAGNAKLHKTL